MFSIFVALFLLDYFTKWSKSDRERQISCDITYMYNPMDRGAWQATVHGVSRARHDWATKPPPYILNSLFSSIFWFLDMLPFHPIPPSYNFHVGEFGVFDLSRLPVWILLISYSWCILTFFSVPYISWKLILRFRGSIRLIYYIFDETKCSSVFP